MKGSKLYANKSIYRSKKRPNFTDGLKDIYCHSSLEYFIWRRFRTVWKYQTVLKVNQSIHRSKTVLNKRLLFVSRNIIFTSSEMVLKEIAYYYTLNRSLRHEIFTGGQEEIRVHCSKYLPWLNLRCYWLNNTSDMMGIRCYKVSWVLTVVALLRRIHSQPNKWSKFPYFLCVFHLFVNFTDTYIFAFADKSTKKSKVNFRGYKLLSNLTIVWSFSSQPKSCYKAYF